jgi:hypothetical protein
MTAGTDNDVKQATARTNNRRSFDSAAHDETVSDFAQDDSKNRQRRRQATAKTSKGKRRSRFLRFAAE